MTTRLSSAASTMNRSKFRVMLFILCAMPAVAAAQPWPERPQPQPQPQAAREVSRVERALCIANFALAVADVETTQAVRDKFGARFRELNPIARPFVSHRAKMYPVWLGEAYATHWLAQRLRRSEKKWLRRLWWTPYALNLGINAWGVQQNVRSLRGRR